MVFAGDGRLQRLGASCFYGCALERVVLPASLEEIRERAFYGCKLREVEFGEGSRLKTVGDYAFSANEGLGKGSVRFPGGAQVSEEAFYLDHIELLYRELYRNRWPF